LIEDNCESLGSEYKNIKLGNFGQASTFSFFIGHHMSTIEGGAVCTDDPKIYNMLKMVRSHGWDRNVELGERKRLRSKYKIDDFYGKYTFYDLAYNFRPTEIQGFLGLNQMKYIEQIIRRRENNYKKLLSVYKNEDFEDTRANMTRVSNFAFPLVCKSKKLKEKYVKICNKAGIENRPIVAGLITKQPFYIKYVKEKIALPNSERVHDNGLYFGNNPEMTNREISYIIKVLDRKTDSQNK